MSESSFIHVGTVTSEDHKMLTVGIGIQNGSRSLAVIVHIPGKDDKDNVSVVKLPRDKILALARHLKDAAENL